MGKCIKSQTSNLEPLKHLGQLKYLKLYNEKKGKLDFDDFPNLVQLHGHYSKKYLNVESLSNLEFLDFSYYPEKDLQKFRHLSKLKELRLRFSNCESLIGLNSLNNLEKITLEDCKRLTSFEGVTQKNINLEEIVIHNCSNLKSIEVIGIVHENISLSIDGKQPENNFEMQYDPLKSLVQLLSDEEKNQALIQKIEIIVKRLKLEVSPKNWRGKLKDCVIHLNELNSENDFIFTEEREAFFQIIQAILIDFDTYEVDQIIYEFSEW